MCMPVNYDTETNNWKHNRSVVKQTLHRCHIFVSTIDTLFCLIAPLKGHVQRVYVITKGIMSLTQTNLINRLTDNVILL